MPQYYSGADPTQAFSSGLMAGYEFIDRIKARAEQLRLQKRAEERDDARFQMQKEGFATQQKMAGLQIEDLEADIADEKKERDYRDEQRPIQQAKADVLYGQQVEAGGLAIAEQRGRLSDAENLRRGRAAYADLLQDAPLGGTPTLGEIGMQGTQTRTGEGTVLKPSLPASAPAKPVPANPLDLTAKQAEIDAEPGFLGKAVRAVRDAFKEGSQKIGSDLGQAKSPEFWTKLANPQRIDAKGVPSSRAIVEENLARNIRQNPLPYASEYIRDRAGVPEKDREALDFTMRKAAAERAAAIKQEVTALNSDPKNQPKIKRLVNEWEQINQITNELNKATGKTVGNEVLPQGGTTSADDPKVLPAVLRAKQAQDASGVLPRVTEQSLRIQQTQLGRMDNPARLTKQQLNLLSEAFRGGAIDPQTYMNWRRYGGPLAPQPPKVIPFGAGKGVVLYPNGQLAEIDFGGGRGGKGGGGGGGSDGGATFGQSIEFIKDTLNARIKRGDLPDAVEGTGIHEMGQMMLFMQRYAPEFQQRNPEVELLDENGEMTMDWARNPLDALKVMNYYINRRNGLDEPDETVDPLPDGPGAMPETPWVQ